jgi:Protein of unknown function (DUF1115)/RWD domain
MRYEIYGHKHQSVLFLTPFICAS